MKKIFRIFVIFHCLILLSTRLPLDFFKYLATLFSRKNKPTLYQRYISTIISTILETLPLWIVRTLVYSFGFVNNILNGLWPGSSKRSYWSRKLKIKDSNWKGYFIAENAKKLEVGQDADVVILYAHGGGFVTGGALLHFATFIDWIKTWKSTYGTTTHILTLEYGLSPKNPFPVARDSMLECYEWLVNEQGIDSSKIVFAGDDVGGNLAVVAALELIQSPYAYSVNLPSSLVLISPCLSGLPDSKSFINHKGYDVISTPWLKRSFDKYMNETNLSSHCSLISPIYEKKLSSLPKIWACSGEFEVYLDDVKQFIENARAQSVHTEFVMENNNFHGYAVCKLLDRNNGAKNTCNHIGKFLFHN